MTQWVIGEKAIQEKLGDGFNASLFFAMAAACHLIVRVPFTFVWKCAADKFGKFNVFLFFNFAFALQHMSFVFIGEGDVVLCLVLSITWGIVYAGHWLIRDIAADVMDYDEFLTGQRREGQFTMILDLIPKLVAMLTEAVPFLLMGHFGYNPELEEQSAGVKWTLRLSFSVVPGVCGLLASMVLLSFPLKTAEQHSQVIEGVKRHKDGLMAIDPTTGLEVPATQVQDDGSVLVDDEMIPQNHWEILQYFTPHEIQRTLDADDTTALYRVPIATIILSVALGSFGIGVFVDGFAELAKGHHSWSPLGMTLVGSCLFFIFVSIVRLRKAHTAIKYGIPNETLEIMVKMFHSHGHLNDEDSDEELDEKVG
eukprot:gnl/MRDRNA2_/MRDRNA2_76226_c0_seq1.p1 gnl/MRDRNA2_/MRDRNA2_76226_c0~~gnl/MRDRNA2_/MRDRNA2_76226_c0_seq1.p1  ORF type:complete len:367 (+),score=67.92 gnl/MRDRNA2_/MRDRNA2_76226_c0_seq1:126-1226(+)